MDIDVPKKGIDIIIYYVKQEYIEDLGINLKRRLPHSIIQPIIYLNRIFYKLEIRYQLTKIKVIYII